MGLKLDTFLPYRLNRISEAVSNSVRPVYKEMYGMNRPEWRVLAALADLGPTTATDICAHSAQHKTKVSRAVHSLEGRKWLTRHRDPNDRRTERLTLSPAGQHAYCALVGPMRASAAAILDRLTPEERKALETALSALENIIEIDPGAPED
ncbi:MAG: MarR family winged helix-turn-helix transcriptional regulator [Pseudomonadota bacterium]